MMPQSQYPVPPWMFGAVQNVESGGNPNAVSPAGAVGPMQTMPSTLTDPGFGVMPAQNNSPQEQQRVGNDYLQAMNDRYKGNQQLALMAYNWGPGHVDKLLSGQLQSSQIPAETQAYAPKVLGQGQQYADAGNSATDAQVDPKMQEQEFLLKARARLRLQQKNQQPEQPSIAEDVTKSVGSNLAEGALSVPLGFGNLGNSLVAGPQLLGRGVAEGVDSLLGVQPQPRGPLWAPFYDSGDAAKDLGVDYQPKTGWGAAAAIPAQVIGSLGAAKGISKGIDTITNIDSNSSRGLFENNQSEPSNNASYTPQDIKSQAVNFYNSSESKGGMLNPESVSKAIAEAQQKAGFQSEEGKAFAGENVVTKTLKDLESLQGKPLSLKGAGEIDDELGDRISSAFRTGNDDQAARLMKIRDTMRDAYTKAGEGDMVNPSGFSDWRTGDKLWSAYRSMDDVQSIIENGEKADVPATAIKNGFKAFVKNDRNLAPFNDEEIAALNHAAKTGIVTGALKTIGSKIISGVAGGLGGAAGGGIPGGLIGAAVGEGVGFPFRSAANALQKGRASSVMDLISQRPDVQNAMKIGFPPEGSGQ